MKNNKYARLKVIGEHLNQIIYLILSKKSIIFSGDLKKLYD